MRTLSFLSVGAMWGPCRFRASVGLGWGVDVSGRGVVALACWGSCDLLLSACRDEPDLEFWSVCGGTPGEKRRRHVPDRSPDPSNSNGGGGGLGSLTWVGESFDLHDFLFGEGGLKEVDLLIWVGEGGGLSWGANTSSLEDRSAGPILLAKRTITTQYFSNRDNCCMLTRFPPGRREKQTWRIETSTAAFVCESRRAHLAELVKRSDLWVCVRWWSVSVHVCVCCLFVNWYKEDNTTLVKGPHVQTASCIPAVLHRSPRRPGAWEVCVCVWPGGRKHRREPGAISPASPSPGLSCYSHNSSIACC